jgi:hypothetical protein
VSAADHAKAIVEKVVARYAAMTTYCDSGAVDTHLNDSDPVLSTTFSTWFRKPSLFRFEFERPHAYPPLRHIVGRNVVGFDGSEAYNWARMGTDAARMAVKENLSLAIAGATGISSGCAHTIGKLLMPGIGGRSILELLEMRQDADMPVDGIPCYSVTAKHPKGGDVRFLIEKEALLVRRVTTERETSGHPSTERRERIRVDEPIDDSVFKRPA